jgi:hypothetical protein
MFGFLGFLYRMRSTFENSRRIISNNLKKFLGCGDVLAPFASGKNPEQNKNKEDDPGQSKKIMIFYGIMKSKKVNGPVNFKAS